MVKTKILIVEDEKITAEQMKIDLENSGYQVIGSVVSGEEAIKMVEELPVDLVIMDIYLKGEMDGIEAAREIRDRFGIPVIFLTAYSDEDTVQRAKLTEPSGYIIKEPFDLIRKPFIEDELLTTIEITLYRHRMEKRLRDKEVWLGAVLDNISDAVIATDSSKQIKFMNSLAEDLTGWIETEAIGNNIEDVLRIDGIDYKLKKVLKEILTVPVEQAELISQDNTHTLIEGGITPIKDDNGEIKGLVVTFHAIDKK